MRRLRPWIVRLCWWLARQLHVVRELERRHFARGGLPLQGWDGRRVLGSLLGTRKCGHRTSCQIVRSGTTHGRYRLTARFCVCRFWVYLVDELYGGCNFWRRRLRVQVDSRRCGGWLRNRHWNWPRLLSRAQFVGRWLGRQRLRQIGEIGRWLWRVRRPRNAILARRFPRTVNKQQNTFFSSFWGLRNPPNLWQKSAHQKKREAS